MPIQKNRNQEEEYVMVVSTSTLWSAGYFEGLCFDMDKYLRIIEIKEGIVFKKRKELENNPKYKQIIPYAILSHDGTVFSYQRGKLLGEQRLLGDYSIGLGGHISPHDVSSFEVAYESAMRRELNEEVEIDSTYKKEVFAALVNDDSDDVGKVHFGMIHVLYLDKPNVRPKEKSIDEATFVDPTFLLKHIAKYENWSQICIRNIERLLAV